MADQEWIETNEDIQFQGSALDLVKLFAFTVDNTVKAKAHVVITVDLDVVAGTVKFEVE